MRLSGPTTAHHKFCDPYGTPEEPFGCLRAKPVQFQELPRMTTLLASVWYDRLSHE